MICAECGGSNRDGASYCDSCGKPLSEATRTKAERSSFLVGMMTLDWIIGSAMAGLAGIAGAAIAVSVGRWDFVFLFVLISTLGWGVLAYTIRNAP